MMTEEADQTAAAYVRGLSRSHERDAIESRLTTDANLRRKVGFWESKFIEIDLAVPPEAPEHGIFDSILAAVDAFGPARGALRPDMIPGTLTRHAGTGEWVEKSPGVEWQILFDNPLTKRRSLLLRMAPGAAYSGHSHEGGYEECLVLEGDLAFGGCKLKAGDFHVAATDSFHPLAVSINGCLLHISAPI
jgi:anti-sigma factor ChrR (cupin superfamily)